MEAVGGCRRKGSMLVAGGMRAPAAAAVIGAAASAGLPQSMQVSVHAQQQPSPASPALPAGRPAHHVWLGRRNLHQPCRRRPRVQAPRRTLRCHCPNHGGGGDPRHWDGRYGGRWAGAAIVGWTDRLGDHLTQPHSVVQALELHSWPMCACCTSCKAWPLLARNLRDHCACANRAYLLQQQQRQFDCSLFQHAACTGACLHCDASNRL